MIKCANADPEFIKIIITGDETWVYSYYPKTETQSFKWKTPVSMSKESTAIMKEDILIAFFTTSA